MPKWDNENVKLEFPDEEKIQCKDCVFRLKDAKLPSGTVIKGCTKGLCEVYKVNKPHDVLWEGAECDYYVSEKD